MQQVQQEVIKVCMYGSAKNSKFPYLMSDICDFLEASGHRASILELNSSCVTEVVQMIDESSWVLMLLTSEDREQLIKNPAIDRSLRKKILNNSLLTLQITDPAHQSAPKHLATIQWADISGFERKYPRDRNDTEQLLAWKDWLRKQCRRVIDIIDAGNSYTDDIASIANDLRLNAPYSHLFLTDEATVGRDWLVEEIKEWTSQHAETSCLIEGPVGIGKSAFCEYFASLNPTFIRLSLEQMTKIQEIDAHFFVRNLAFQLATKVKTYRDWLVPQLKENSKFSIANLMSMNPIQLLNELIINAPDADKRSREVQFVIIDGIDRVANAESSRIDLFNVVKEVIKIGLPYNFRMLITSRPHEEVSGLFKKKTFKLMPRDERNISDVNSFLCRKLTEQGGTRESLESFLPIISSKADGSMLHAGHMVGAMVQYDVSSGQEIDCIPRELCNFYLDIMVQLFGQKKWIESIHGATPSDFARVIVESNGPIRKSQLMATFEMKRRHFRQSFARLYPLLIDDKAPDGEDTISFFHWSFSHWLKSPRDPHPYQIYQGR